MKKDEAQRKPRQLASRWVARALGGLVFLFYARQGWYELQHLVSRQEFSDHLLSAGLVAALVGIVVAWFAEGLGSHLILIGYALATIPAAAFALSTGDPWHVSLVLSLIPFLVVGVLHRRAWAITRRNA